MSRTTPRKRASVNYAEDADEVSAPAPAKSPTPKKPTPKKPTPKKAVKRAASDDDEAVEAPKPKKRTKTAAPKKKSKDEDAMPLAARTVVSSLKHAMRIGAHVSAAGGVANALPNAVHIGANAFALFLKSQRKWDNPPLAPEARDAFVSGCKHHDYSAGEHALPHGSYLVNLAQVDETKAATAYKSFVDDLKRCDSLGIRLYNFHPGSTGGEPRPAAIARIAKQLNKAHIETESVITVLENMAGAGNVVGSTWEDLRDIIALVDKKDRVGVCIDTCHAFAAGLDLRTPETFRKTMDDFNEIVGLTYLKAFHRKNLNTSFFFPFRFPFC